MRAKNEKVIRQYIAALVNIVLQHLAKCALC